MIQLIAVVALPWSNVLVMLALFALVAWFLWLFFD